jgi:hypothetical protein
MTTTMNDEDDDNVYNVDDDDNHHVDVDDDYVVENRPSTKLR